MASSIGDRFSRCIFSISEPVYESRRVFPYKFLLRHYPIRSQEHGLRKVFTERRPRWNPEERADGWHTQYDRIQREHSFLESTDDAIRFEFETFYREYLVETLSGVGVPRISPT